MDHVYMYSVFIYVVITC